MMTRIMATGLFAVSILGSFYAAAGSGDAVSFPSEYRMWTHVKSALVGPESPSFARNGGIHHFYANKKGMEGYRTGKFPNGSVLIDDGLEVRENAGITTEGPRRRVAVMVKDSKRFRDTGGWGFELFPGDSQGPGALTAEAKAACYDCHQKGHDSVFSKYRK